MALDTSIDFFIFGNLEQYIESIFTVETYDENKQKISTLTISSINIKNYFNI